MLNGMSYCITSLEVAISRFKDYYLLLLDFVMDSFNGSCQPLLWVNNYRC